MSSLRDKDVLVVDDADDIRVMAMKILETDGASVSGAPDVDTALAMARQKAPHLIVTDLEMPGKTGFDLLELFKKDPSFKGIPILVLSGMNDRASVIRAISLGAADYILKPFRAPLLLQKVRKSLMLSSFRTRTVRPNEDGRAKLSIPIDILKINEIGCQVEGVIKLGADESLQITSELMDGLEIQNILMRSSSENAKYVSGGRYISEVNFVGLDNDMARKIRAKIASMK